MNKETPKTGPVAIREGFFVVPPPPEPPYLIGNRCRDCGEVFFPSRTCCRHCSSENMEPMQLSRTGKLYSFTTIRVKPPHCIIPVPFTVGIVEIDNGERIRTLLTGGDQSSLQIGLEMELVVEGIGKAVAAMGKVEIGQEVIGWKFRPVQKEQK